jgi:hypothetical protein
MTESFEEKMAAMAGMSEEEINRTLEDVKHTCRNFCGECPTHTSTEETKLAFCLQGGSEIIKDEKGCLCPGCPVTRKLSLRWDYFCTNGSGREQAGIN